MTQILLFIPIIWLPIVWWAIGPIIVILFGGFFYAISAGEAESIAILGSRNAGKTTLWKQLRGEFENADNIRTTVGKEEISEFTIEYDGTKKTIKKSADFGGTDELVHRYGEIIEDGTFIFYLIDLTMLKENKDETRGRLRAIATIIKKRELKVGLQLIGTHYKKFQETTGLSKEEAKKSLENSLVGKIKNVEINDRILIAELTDRNDIMQIVKQIFE